MTKNVLFLCTGNSARSVMAEALLNLLGAPLYKAYSAGSQPAGAVNPFTFRTLARHQMHADGYRSKSWDEFAEPGAPAIDLVVTVCDRAAAEICPVWPGRPTEVHWSTPDPAALEGTDADKDEEFERVFNLIRARVEAFVAEGLPAKEA